MILSDMHEVMEAVWEWVFGNLVLINIILSVIIVFFQRRDPKSVWTWLLVLYFVPVFGILFYLILAQDYRKSKLFRIKAVEDRLHYSVRKQEIFFKEQSGKAKDENIYDYLKLIRYNLNAGSAILTVFNKVEIFKEGKEKFADLIEEIRGAKSFIHIEYYIIKNDELFDIIAMELIKKARQGVEVRILADGMGSRFMPKKKWKALEAEGIKIAIFFPAALGRINLRVNYRNHRKIVIIDGNIGYLGGFNIGREYIGQDPKFGNWRDTHLKICGEAVASLGARFALDWNYASKENLFKEGKYKIVDPEGTGPGSENEESFLCIQIITSGPDSRTRLIRDNYIELFNNAKNHIYIHTPYFVPDEAVMSALSIAARAGVDVRLMIPCMPDHPFVYSATLSWAGSLLEQGAKVYTYQEGFLHAKSVMVDGLCACVGTANMDIRSFELNFEVNATIYDEATVQKLEADFLEDIGKSREITEEIYRSRGLVQRLKEQFSRLLSPLL